MSDPGKLSEYYRTFHRERAKAGTVRAGQRIEFLVRHVGRGKRVLDLGCRYGDLTQHYLEGNEVVGVDIDAEALAECARRTGIETKVQDLNQALEFPDETFDVVVLAEVLEHLPYPDLTLGEVRRVLRPGGILVGSVPNGTRLRNRLTFLFTGVVEHDPTHLWHYGARSLSSKLGRLFERVSVELAGGRFLRLWPRMMAKYLFFTAVKPGS